GRSDAYGEVSVPTPRRGPVRRPGLPWLAGGAAVLAIVVAGLLVPRLGGQAQRAREVAPAPAPAPPAASPASPASVAPSAGAAPPPVIAAPGAPSARGDEAGAALAPPKASEPAPPPSARRRSSSSARAVRSK